MQLRSHPFLWRAKAQQIPRHREMSWASKGLREWNSTYESKGFASWGRLPRHSKPTPYGWDGRPSEAAGTVAQEVAM